MNQKVKTRIEGYKYWDIFEEDVEDRTNQEVLSDMPIIMDNAIEGVNKRARETGKNAEQVRRNVAGNYFQALVSYATADSASANGLKLLHDKKLESTDIAGAVPTIGDDETILSPDADIVYYDPEDDSSPIYILSCKTSFRERMSQSGMWKLLFEISEHSCTDSDCMTNDYEFSAGFDRDIYMGIATVDFYDDVKTKDIVEIFDFVYSPSVNKDNTVETLYPLSELFDHLEGKWSSSDS